MSQPRPTSSRAIRARPCAARRPGARSRSANAVRRTLAALAFSTLVACGASLPKQGVAPAKTPTTVDEALAQLDGAELQLDGVVPPATTPPAVQGGAPPAQGQPTLPAPAPATGTGPREMAPGRDGDEHDAVLQYQDPCVTACRALSSMSRAATHVCGLAGDDDARCTEARARVDRATQRVRSACPACS